MKISRTAQGLLDSDRLDKSWYSGDRPTRADELVGTESSYVLLAPGGSGKSTLIKELRTREPSSAVIDLRMHDRQSLKAEIASVTAAAKTCFIDALDEALQLDPNLNYVLTRLLDSDDARRVNWRIACRPASWTFELAAGLRAALNGLVELELLPLDMAAVDVIAGDDFASFVAAVDREQLTHLLAQPLSASDLLSQWRGTGELPATRSDAMNHTVSRLLAESGAFRPNRKQDDVRTLMVAERLAAMTLLCSVGRYAMGGLPAGSPGSGAGSAPSEWTAIALTAVPVNGEPDLDRPLELDDIREILGTPLFAAAGDGCVAFVHQSYAEFLTARYLVRRLVGGPRLLSLLGADTNGLVPGPMIEVLGWMLALGADVPDPLIQHNAKQLLGTAGLELAGLASRARVVQALLHGAADGTISDGWGLDLSGLAHPELGSQLHEAAVAVESPWAIFWIARIARHCLVFEVADDLLAIATCSKWNSFMRSEAIQSFAGLAPLDRMHELESLFCLNSDEDPDDEILAAALRARLAENLSPKRLSEVLRRPRRPSYIGGYYSLLTELPSLLGVGQALPLLEEVLPKLNHTSGMAIERLIAGLLTKVWEEASLDDAAALGALLGRADHLPEGRFNPDRAFPWEHDNKIELRREMTLRALEVGEKSFYPVLRLRLLSPSDLCWLAEWMPAEPSSVKESAEIVLRQLAWAVDDAQTASFVVSVAPEHPAYAILSQFQGAVALDDRPDWVTEALEHNAEQPSATELAANLREAIRAAQDDISTWWTCTLALAGDWEYGTHDTVFSWDLTARPLWAELNLSEREAFWQLALAYVEDRQPTPADWENEQSWNLPQVLPDWSGVHAIASLAVHHPQTLGDVSPSTWERWAPTLVAIPTFLGADAWRPALLKSAPPACAVAINVAVCEHIRNNKGASFSHNQFADFQDLAVLAAVADVARNVDDSLERRDMALSVLTKNAPSLALEIARTALEEPSPPHASAEVMASLAPEEFLASRIDAGIVPILNVLSKIDIEKLTDATLSSLAGLLLDHIPFKDSDSSGDSGFVQSTVESEVGRLRMPVLQAMAARGLTGRLETLITGRDATNVEQIQHVMQQSREREALINWRPVDPATLIDVITSGDARLVRNGSDLLGVLIEQLAVIQEDLKGRALFRSVWDKEPGSAEASPKVEDDISDWLAHELRLRLSPHVVVDREVQVTRPKNRGVGTRIDITVTSPAGVRLGRVLFEAKRVENSELMTALGEQLVDDYMAPAKIDHGVFVVYWIAKELRPKSWKKSNADPSELAGKLRGQAHAHRPGRQIEVVILDIGPPSPALALVVTDDLEKDR